MNRIEEVLRKRTFNMFNDIWYEETVKKISKHKDTQKGYVYFIGNGQDDYVKIGISINLTSRVKSLQTGFGEYLFLYGFIYCENYIDLEKILHKKYNSQRKTGEWFEINRDEVKKEILQNNGNFLNSYTTNKFKVIDGMPFDFKNNYDESFFSKENYDLFNEYIVKNINKNERYIKRDFYRNVSKLNEDYKKMSPKRVNLLLKKYCMLNRLKYFEFNSNGKRGFILG